MEIYQPSRLYSWTGWAALAGSAVGVACGFRAPMAFIPASLCAVTAAVLFWLAARPWIRTGEMQFNVGERTIAWREVREINTCRFNAYFVAPLILKLKLTNSRRRLLVFPGDVKQIDQLTYDLRKHSYLATFDGVSHRDYWASSTPAERHREKALVKPPVQMLTPEDEDEVERLYQKLKTVGHLDSRTSDTSKTSHED
ncbi:MAG: hypothetical protein JOY62_10565 [Acidobacteriaceae bacterium]|nr:hypothetical protein [Acidobacteriaceae bacterium]MBV9780403.1 hypothetical protein [Acidobacteriaceae bacterium]